MSPRSLRQTGFTIIELVVSIAIFAAMTTLVVAKYSNFNNSVLFTNLAYDIALTLRTAQTYGLSVQGRAQSGQLQFQYPYGIAICVAEEGCLGANDSLGNSTQFHNNEIIMFADTNSGATTDRFGAYDKNDILVQTYAIKRGAKIVCVEEEEVSSRNFQCNPTGDPDNFIKRADITFVRPNPDAVICATKNNYDPGGNFTRDTIPNACFGKGGVNMPMKSVAIQIQAPDGSTRNIVIRQNGQISVEN